MSRGYYLTALPLLGIGSAYALPLTAFLATIGATRDAFVTQAPESEAGIFYGDDTRDVEPFQIRLQIVSTSERAASDILAAIITQARAGTSVLRWDGVGGNIPTTIRRRDYLKFKSYKGDAQLGQQHVLPVTLEFLPAKPFWTDRDGNGDYPY